jgi:hypothetical protein
VVGKCVRLETLANIKQNLAKLKLTTGDPDEDNPKKKQSKVEKALLAAWGNSMG